MDLIPSYVAVRSRDGLLVRLDLDPSWDGTDVAWEYYDYRDAAYERTNTFTDPRSPPWPGCAAGWRASWRAGLPPATTRRADLSQTDAPGALTCRRLADPSQTDAGSSSGRDRSARSAVSLRQVGDRLRGWTPSRASWSSTTTTPTRGTSCTSSPRSPARCPTVVQHDEHRRGRPVHSTTSSSRPAPAPADPADFAVGRAVLLAGTRAGARRLPGHAGPGDGVRRAGRAGRAGARRGRPVAHDGRGVFAGLPAAFAAVRYHSLAATRRARRARGDARPPARTAPVVMGVRHRDAAARGRAVPPRVGAQSEHGARAGRQLPGEWRDDRPGRVAFFARSPPATRPLLLARRRRRPRVVGPPVAARLARRRRRLADLRRRAPRGHPARRRARRGGRRRRLRGARGASSPTDGPDEHWVGYLGYACRPDLPAARDPGDCPTRCGCAPAHVRVFDHPEPAGRAGADAGRPRQAAPGARRSTPRRSPRSRSSCTRATATRST